MKDLFLFLFLFAAIAFGAFAQEPVGIFDDHKDVGEPGVPGLVEYDSTAGLYKVDAVGATIGNRLYADEFHFAYKKISGSFAIEANPMPVDNVGRGGLMIRQTLDPDSAHISLLMTSQASADSNSSLGSIFPTFRTLKGGGSIRDGDLDAGGFTTTHTGPIRLERIGNSVHFYTQNSAGNWVWFQSEAAPYEEEVLAGLAATAENTNSIGLFEFTGVRIEELPLNTMRDLPVDDLKPGASLTGITITAKARSQIAGATVHEVLPLGASASNVKVSDGNAILNTDGTIDWYLTDLSGEATLTYDMVLGQHASALWRGTFTDGVQRSSYIGGETLLPKTPTFTPPSQSIAIDPIFPTMIQAEQGAWLRAETDFGLMIDLKATEGISIIGTSGSAQGIVEYPITIAQAGTYYVFARVRSEDGNSDSFHFNIDDYPAGDGTTYWSISQKKNYANEWVSSDSPREDPRAFQLEAGEHFLYLANREDSASVDWFCVTSNRNLTISTFSETTDYFITRTIPNRVLESGKTYDVTITRAANPNVQLDMSVTDTPPPGWTVSNIKVSGGNSTTNEKGQLVWSLAGVSGSQTFTYTVTPPAGDILGGLFEGTYVLQNQESPLPGDSVIAKVFTFQNVNAANPTPIKLVNGEVTIEAEDAYLVKPTADAADPFSIRYDSTAQKELYVYAERGSNTITGEELDFYFEIIEPGTYRAIARSRTPSGNDDSLFLGMDDDIGVDLPTYRYQGAFFVDAQNERIYDNDFHAGWVGVDGNADLSWELAAGVHRLRFHIREDGTQLDWVMITNNLDRNPADLEPVVSIIDFMLY